MQTSPLPHTTTDPTRCPLCGGDNRCAMEVEKATGEPQPPCWCVTETFSPDLLARLPEAAQGQACICARCLARFNTRLTP
ncbi:MAG: cysteine-rich CWC family protein [Hydrogenophaga sp.]|uniref:cysteine-rich CWC family protein n=1 Tax=Hydrogenophaga sp. TaxID=1904254 RepID=UPI0025C11F8C|nr:cysteine-rich CWC family protein [Hydrogenophaga sp.]MBT9550537.1 cysteine-rich CWC family protein [Hydrogenophaga sp.]